MGVAEAAAARVEVQVACLVRVGGGVDGACGAPCAWRRELLREVLATQSAAAEVVESAAVQATTPTEVVEAATAAGMVDAV